MNKFKKIHQNLKSEINKPLIILLFLSYLIILIWIVIFKYNSQKSINVLLNGYINMDLYSRFMNQFTHFNGYIDKQTVRQILLNIPIFIPLTLLLPLLFKKQNMIRDLLIAFSFSLTIELFQLFLALGGFEFLDLLTNFIGALIGSIIFYVCRRHTKDVVINYISLSLDLIAVPFAFYAIIKTIINYQLYVPFFSFF